MSTSNYAGYLIKIGNSLSYQIPLQYMDYASYEGVHSTLDSDAHRNANNATLLRTVIGMKSHCKVTIRSLPEVAVSDMFTHIKQNIITDATHDAKEEAINVSFWVPKLGNYVQAVCYIPDVTIKIKHIEGTKVIYEPFDLEFIEY